MAAIRYHFRTRTEEQSENRKGNERNETLFLPLSGVRGGGQIYTLIWRGGGYEITLFKAVKFFDLHCNLSLPERLLARLDGVEDVGFPFVIRARY